MIRWAPFFTRACPLRYPFLSLLLLISFLSSRLAFSHGGVAFEEDLCVINIEFLQAHFTVYQSETSGNEEYCENIPDVTRSVFVMEYLHDMLLEMPVDFRIIRDVNNVGKYATWEDIQSIDDIEAVTAFYEAPHIEPGGFYRTSYEFEERGTYIGIVTAQHPTEDKFYNAVFYFRVGGADLGTIPIFVLLLLLLQLVYWLSSGGWSRLKQRSKFSTSK